MDGISNTINSSKISLNNGSNNGRINIVTWNVAGWRSALEKIKASISSSGGSSGSSNSYIDTWMSRFGADVLCIQEVKESEQELDFKGAN